jgi:hypothetical protein
MRIFFYELWDYMFASVDNGGDLNVWIKGEIEFYAWFLLFECFIYIYKI